jgi:ribosomal-protein-alanine N-acetyltransferase
MSATAPSKVLPAPGAEVARCGRVLLRFPSEADEPEYTALRRASREFLAPWEPTPPRSIRRSAAAAFARLLEICRTHSNQKLFACRIEDGVILGQVSLNNIVRGPFQSSFVGYWIGAEFAGQGYMTESLTAMVAYAFGPMKLHRVEANIIPRNRPSKALAKRCGFRFEGVSKRYLRIGGRWEDHEHWVLTAEDAAVRRAMAKTTHPRRKRRG